MLLVYYSEDPAGRNIASQLLKLGEWRREGDFFVNGDYHLLEVGERISEMERFEAKSFGDFSSMLALSRHASKTGSKVVTTHFTGRLSKEEKELSLSLPAPDLQLSLMKALKERISSDYPLSLECTHHGPYETDVPSLFVEIGSTEREWEDRKISREIATAIMELKIEKPRIVCVGFGGGHYAPRQTKLLLESEIAFAHIIPNHRLEDLNERNVKKIFEISQTDFCYVDRKSMKGDMRRFLDELLKDYIQISEGNLRVRPESEVYRRIIKRIEDPVLTERVNETSQEFHEFSSEFFNIAMSVDSERVREILSEHCGAYSKDGSILMCNSEDLSTILIEILEILKKRYSISVDDKSSSLILMRCDEGGKVINSRKSKEVKLKRGLIEVLKKVEI